MAGSEQTYVQNPHYWQRSAVHYKTVTVKAIANPATVEDALTSGQIDVAYTATPATAAIASQAAKIVAPYCFNCLLTLDREGVVLKPLGDPRVRQALSYAVDGAAIGKAIWTNRYMTPSHNILSPGTIGYSASSDNSYPYNQAKARQLLAEAGYAHGFTLPLTVLGPMDPNSTFTEAVAAQLNSVGIKATIKVIPTIQEFIPLQMSKKLPLMVHQPLLGLSMLEFYNNYLAPTSGFNPFGVVDAEVETLMAKAARMSASDARAVYEMVAKRVIQLAWFNPYYHFDEILLTDKKVANVAISGANNIPDPVAPVASEGWRPE